MSQRIPDWVITHNAKTSTLARMLGVPHAHTLQNIGLYAQFRKGDKHHNNSRKYILVQYRVHAGVDGVALRERVPVIGFPSDHLITKLSLVIEKH